MQILRQGTVEVIQFGPFVDKDDGLTLKTDATTITDIDHATTGIFVSKNGAAAAVRHQAIAAASVADAYGMMRVTLDATDTETLGTLDVTFAKAATYLPVNKEFMVIPATLYDTLFVAQPCAAINKFFDKASPTGTVNSLPDAVPGAAGGAAIAGSNAATTFATLSVTGQMDAGSVVIDAGFDVVGALSANSLLIDTTTTLTGNVSCAAAFDVVGALTAGSVSIDAGVDVVGALSANSVLVDTTTTLTGAVSLGSTLGVTGITTFTGAVNANITGNITGNLSGSVGSLTGHTNQSGNSYPIVSHADYGNAKLVRSTTPANTLDVSATGEVGLDFDNIKDATGAHTLTNITVPTVTTTGTCTTNSDMRGTDNAATAAKLTKYVQLLARSDAAIATDNGTELTEINADGGSGGGDYSNQTEAVEALRDHIGDGTNLTEAGGTGDHLTAINLPNQTMDITGDITGNLSGSVGSVAGNVDGDVSGNVAGTVTGVTPSSHDAADVKTAIEAAGSHLTLIKAVTDALTAAAATKLATSTGTIVTGTVSHDNTAATTSIFYCDDITEATADHFNGRIIIFTSGALQYQATDITDYALVAGEGKFTVSTLTEAPADNTTFIIV